MNFLQHIQGSDKLSRGTVMVHAARFLQFDDRLSTVFMASNEQETITRDPALNIFKAFGDLKHITVVPHLLVARINDFPKDLAQLAYANHSELVVIPFQPFKIMKQEAEPTSISAWLNVSEGPRQNMDREKIVAHLDIIADQLIRKCRVKVAILVDAGVQKRPLTTVSILIPFFGGQDDRESVLLALRIGALRKVTIHILHITILDSTRKPNGNIQDLEMIKYIQSLENNGNQQCIVTYEKVESSTLTDPIFSHLEKNDYSLVIVGHFGPYWTLYEEENQDEESTVWSLSKIQSTINSLSSNNELSHNPTLLESVLGPIGLEIYHRNPSSASLLVLRKSRAPES